MNCVLWNILIYIYIYIYIYIDIYIHIYFTCALLLGDQYEEYDINVVVLELAVQMFIILGKINTSKEEK